MSHLKRDLFLKNFRELLEDLSRIYTNDKVLSMCLLSFNTMASLKPNYIVSETIAYLKPYNEKILEKDEDFLFQEIEKDFSSQDHSWIVSEMRRVKEIWNAPETTHQTKECIWKYLTNFVKLGKAIEKTL